jgi:hypothetical protein
MRSTAARQNIPRNLLRGSSIALKNGGVKMVEEDL